MDDFGEQEPAALPVLTGGERSIVAQRARAWLRSGLAAPAAPSAMVEAARSIGREAIAEAVDLALRVADGGWSLPDRVRRPLDELIALRADPVEDRPAAARWFGRLRRGGAPMPPLLPRLSELVGELGVARDELLHHLTRLDSVDTRLARAEARLVEAGHLLRESIATVEAAARELGAEGAWLRQDLAPVLGGRAEDILAQWVITRQNRAALELARDGGQALAGAVERAGRIMASALATADTARRAVAEQALLRERADALAVAVGDGEGGGRGATAILDEALRDIRASLDRMASPARR